MIYILDTNIIRKIFFHLPKKGKTFELIWEALERGIEQEEYISVDECYNELARQFSKDVDAFKWINERKKMFLNPNNSESLIIRRLFENPKFRESIHSKNILDNRPSADVYIVAKACEMSAVVVTAEEYKPNSAQLPNLCEALNVKYIDYDTFMEVVSDSID